MSSDLFKFKFTPEKKPLETGSDRLSDVPQIKLSDEAFRDLREHIYNRCGIYFNEGKKYLLEGRIAKRILANNLSTFEQYLNLLKSTHSRDELNAFFEAITINETYFFRAEQQFEAFEKILIPEIIKNKQATGGGNTFRIWSAASSTGEEPYTLAMMILERVKPLFPHVNFQILGSDINNAVLDAARKGIYKEYAIRNVPSIFMKKYFKEVGNTFVLSDEVKRMVRFTNINLYDQAQMRAVSGCDVIFCCNVLIYFDIPSKSQVVSYLYDALNRGGYLMIGYSESLHGVSKAFKLIHLPKALAYKKE